MRYMIKGTDKRYGMKYNYGTYSCLKDAVYALDTFKRHQGETVKFQLIELPPKD